MIEKLISRLQKAHLELTPEEIADILWLAPLIQQSSSPETSPTVIGQEDDVKPPQPSDDLSQDFPAVNQSPSKPETEALPNTLPPVTGEPAPAQETSLYPTVIDGSSQLRVGETMRAPAAPSLPNKQQLIRSLRPLFRKTNSRIRFELDELATVNLTAQTGFCTPVLRPVSERWLDMVLIVDQWRTMVIWDEPIREFTQLIEQTGKFRKVSVVGLQTGTNGHVELRSIVNLENQIPHPAKEWIDPTGRRAIILISDCMSQAWMNGSIVKLLSQWQDASVVLLHTLPEFLWDATNLRFGEEIPLFFPAPASPISRLIPQYSNFQLPVIPFEPHPIDLWSKAFAGDSKIRLPGYVPGVAASMLLPNSQELTASERYSNFMASASPAARQLAIYLSAVPLTLPIMHTVRQIMLPDSKLSHLAEVILGGLLKQVSIDRPLRQSQNTFYEFYEGVRELLQDNLLRDDAQKILNGVGEFMEDRWGMNKGFGAALLNASDGTVSITPDALPFARVSLDLLKRYGVYFNETVKKLENGLEAYRPPNTIPSFYHNFWKEQVKDFFANQSSALSKNTKNNSLYGFLCLGMLSPVLLAIRNGDKSVTTVVAALISKIDLFADLLQRILNIADDQIILDIQKWAHNEPDLRQMLDELLQKLDVPTAALHALPVSERSWFVQEMKSATENTGGPIDMPPNPRKASTRQQSYRSFSGSSSTLIIGLGGIGAKTLIHVKKMLMDSNPDGLMPDNVNILEVDTCMYPEILENFGTFEGKYTPNHVNLQNVQINPYKEYFWLGGNLDYLCGRQEEDHIARWFDYSYFCSSPVKGSLLNLVNGAGMYRQLGKRGLMHHMQGGTTSALYALLSKAIYQFPERTFNIILCGSLAGGTGASLFVDMAHLVRTIARNNAKEATVTAIMVLPEAFRNTPSISVNDSMRARAMAAMREIIRFMKVHDPDLGVLMQYTRNVADEKINRRTTGSLFDQVFILGEEVSDTRKLVMNPLDAPVTEGIVPMMATWISKLCDHTVYEAYRMKLVNTSHLLNASKVEGDIPAVASTFQTYSVTLPLATIVEEWAIRLALELLDRLVLVDRNGKTLDYIPGAGGELEIPGSIQSRNDGMKHTSPLLRDAINTAMYVTPMTQPAMVAQIGGRKVEDFQTFFILDKKPEDSSIFNRMKEFFFVNYNVGFFGNRYRGAVCPPETQRSAPAELRARILHEKCEQECENEFFHWKKRLNEICDWQLNELFIPEVSIHTQSILNGPVGRIGWILTYLSKQVEDLESALRIFNDASMRLEAKIREMEFLGWKGGKNQDTLFAKMGINASKQNEYLDMRQKWLESSRIKMLIDAEKETFEKMIAFLRPIYQQLEDYRNMLISPENSILQGLLKEQERIRFGRNQSEIKFSRVQKVINDPIWEDSMYHRYCESDVFESSKIYEVLQSLKWEYQLVTINGHIQSDLRLRVLGIPQTRGTPLETDVIDIKRKENSSVDNNIVRLLELTRQPFQSVWKNVSVIDYFDWLIENKGYDNQDYLEIIRNFGNGMMSNNNIHFNPKRSVYIIAPKGTETTHFIDKTLKDLRENFISNDTIASVLPHDDRTTIIFMIVYDGIEIDKTQAYTLATEQYLNQPAFSQGSEISRSINHIFKAEKRAILYDRIEDNGQPYLVPSRITMLLEEELILSDFMLATALNIIHKSLYTTATGQVVENIVASVKQIVNVLGILEEVEEDYCLSKPEDLPIDQELAGFLTAAETFVLRSYDCSNMHRSMHDLRDLVRKMINESLEKTVEEQFPKWLNGEGSVEAVKVAHMPESEARRQRLMIEARKIIYLKFYAMLENWVPSRNKSIVNYDMEFIKFLKIKIESETQSSRL